MDNPTTRGKNVSHLQLTLLDEMDGEDATRLMQRVEELLSELPNPNDPFPPKQGLLLGLVQSGKTVALTTTIAMAADNGYKFFIVLTSDNNWLYKQTASRLKRYLQGMQVEGKKQWDAQMFIFNNLQPEGPGVIFITTKNASVLRNLIDSIESLKFRMQGDLPPTLIVDDEADQASLDTQTSRRSKNPTIAPGTISNLIDQLRQQFSKHVLLQVTATPQALFLQDTDHPYRPEFTTLIEPGKGYIGGNTFFSLDLGATAELIRHIDQNDIENMLTSHDIYVPESLWKALCIFYIASTIKYLVYESIKRSGLGRENKEPKYCFLCHISQKKADHNKAYDTISQCHRTIVSGLAPITTEQARQFVEDKLREAYKDVLETLESSNPPSFEEVLDELRIFVVGTEVQVINSDKEEDHPQYDRRYNIIIGGNKLARGVTIPNLIVTYYGRQAKSPNMDTVLQHARMYGYREKDLDVTRLFLTSEVERRFRLINESEQALRSIIERYPGKQYQGIQIGPGVKATRSNVLNPNNIGSYGAGRSYFPYTPISQRELIEETTLLLDSKINKLAHQTTHDAVEITIDQAVELISLTKSDSQSGGLWDNIKIIAALEELKRRYDNTAYLVVRKDRNLGPNKKGLLRAVLSGARGNYPGDDTFANVNYPTLFMFRLTGKKWDNYPFWVPVLRFPDGQYAILFNFD